MLEDVVSQPLLVIPRFNNSWLLNAVRPTSITHLLVVFNQLRPGFREVCPLSVEGEERGGRGGPSCLVLECHEQKYCLELERSNQK